MVFLLLKSNFSSNNFTIDLEKFFSLDLSNVKIKLSWPSLKFTGSNRTVNPCMRQPTTQTPTPLLQLYLSQFILSETKWYLKLRNRRNSLFQIRLKWYRNIVNWTYLHLWHWKTFSPQLLHTPGWDGTLALQRGHCNVSDEN